MILSAQSIRKHCIISTSTQEVSIPNPLISPFVERGVINGKSYGLSACTYDCRIDQDLILDPIPIRALAALAEHYSVAYAREILNRKFKALASTIERFSFPHNICGSVLDKSSYARVFITAFNTHLDPGWEGWLTVELVNLGDETITYKRGDPLCQVKFEFLDHPTELPYQGKYQNQSQAPTPAKKEL